MAGALPGREMGGVFRDRVQDHPFAGLCVMPQASKIGGPCLERAVRFISKLQSRTDDQRLPGDIAAGGMERAHHGGGSDAIPGSISQTNISQPHVTQCLALLLIGIWRVG
jgi:hypothetical protein